MTCATTNSCTGKERAAMRLEWLRRLNATFHKEGKVNLFVYRPIEHD